ncbi:MAG: NAD(P) transhydrogenase subunit alpha [Tenericutes bacterium]|jgi:H+-translocating NAD(P) transhydrogenase subunit alpha|nr:NAD(P) transhydrogenase subunit alpha [Mycoplasmatota bacterium]
MIIIYLITIFLMTVFLGIELITKVPATLHTPLMSGSNAISGITIVGAIGVLLTQLSYGDVGVLPFILGAIALFFATVNVVGGFVVSHRMLEKFRGNKK